LSTWLFAFFPPPTATKICCTWLKQRLGVGEALLTQSCTSALEMAALLCNLAPGDEVIMPSFTFVSTANAVVLRGATPVFVEIRRDTLNINEGAVESAITPRTKAIFVVHYSGVPCEMNAINTIARRHGLLVVEDAAQALLSTYDGRPAGTLGDIGCFSFHASKNVTSGEGGALVTDRADIAERAHVVWEKGTNRDRFLKGQIDKYTWVDVGSSFLPSELTAAFLAAQLESADEITEDRRATWALYHAAFESLEQAGFVTRPSVPANVKHNGHLYYLLLKNAQTRDSTIRA
jgi:dTDP-4-amino-4,6-dideoxygalactose transaminase